jgi:excisionase family DNA binding protein
MLEPTISPRKLARAVGVSESSIKRWVDEGLVPAQRTRGGHRRIPLAAAFAFVRDTGMALGRPAVLGLSDLSASQTGGSELEDRLYRALLDGRASAACRLILSAYVAGASVAALCDGPLRGAMRRIGDPSAGYGASIFVEHRASAICERALHELRTLLPEVDGAPVAVGGALVGDESTLPSLAASLVLAGEGMRAVDLGAKTPAAALLAAASDERASLVWLSVGYVEGPACERDVRQLVDELGGKGIPLVVGGRALPYLELPECAEVVPTATLRGLAAFVRGRFDSLS